MSDNRFVFNEAICIIIPASKSYLEASIRKTLESRLELEDRLPVYRDITFQQGRDHHQTIRFQYFAETYYQVASEPASRLYQVEFELHTDNVVEFLEARERAVRGFTAQFLQLAIDRLASAETDSMAIETARRLLESLQAALPTPVANIRSV